MTVFCLAELDGDEVADASLRALTLARGLAAEAGTGVAGVVFGAQGEGHVRFGYAMPKEAIVAGVNALKTFLSQRPKSAR